MIKILHTSDLHLGKQLYTKRRYAEFERFLNWMVELIERESVDCLIVSGDIFDTTTPSHRATEQYYNFLAKISKTCCRHVVIIAGNHDSASLLNAPGKLLKALDIHVIALVDDLEKLVESEGNVEKEVLHLYDQQGNPELLVCAVPFLQDRDVRKSKPGESQEEKTQNLLFGIQSHYQIVCEYARQKQMRIYQQHNTVVPIVATGHLYASGSQIAEEDGVRQLYVGTLGYVSASIFPAYLDYVALGHLHTPQKVANSETIRYSGSPIPIGFNEAKHEKSVALVQIEPKDMKEEIAATTENLCKAHVELVPVPMFQRLVQIRGNWEQIEKEIQKLKKIKLEEEESIWLEIDHSGERISDLDTQLEEIIDGSNFEVLQKINRLSKSDRDFDSDSEELSRPSLSEMTVQETFLQRLASKNVPQEEYAELLTAFEEIVHFVENQA